MRMARNWTQSGQDQKLDTIRSRSETGHNQVKIRSWTQSGQDILISAAHFVFYLIQHRHKRCDVCSCWINGLRPNHEKAIGNMSGCSKETHVVRGIKTAHKFQGK